MARPGQPIRDFVTARWYNDITKRARKTKQEIKNGFNRPSYSTATVYNHEAVAKAPYTIVGIGDHKVPNREDNAFDTTDPSPSNWAILQEPLDARVGASAEAVVVGASWLNMGDLAEDPTEYITVEAGSPVASSSGKAQVLHTETDDDDNVWVFAALAVEGGSGGEVLKIGVVQDPPDGFGRSPRAGNLLGTEWIKDASYGTGVVYEVGDTFAVYNVSRKILASGDYVLYQPGTPKGLIVTAFC